MTANKKVVTHTISVIRNRGQLTIPDVIREQRQWASPNSVVTISSNNPNEIIIKPHQPEHDWDKIWEGIRKARAIHGKGKGSTLKFIQKDRLSH